ncbi:hypothetical protein [Effusibacillus pohliae]|uniref:hypothetical protein n=1 Tax=Effusibacillus pohliae TaxID=232270 RepID=UPI000364667C|nr:hypothetical protein [Effusibacillus pohliae]
MDSKLFLFITLCGIGIVLYAAVKGKPDAVGASHRELEASLQAFMDELEKENQYLIDTIEKLQSELQSEINLNRRRIEQLEAKIAEFQLQGGTDRGRSVPQPLEAMPALVFNEHYSRVVTMIKEGRAPEQIAKDTGIGLGEIQMICNLIKQGNAV